MDKLGIQPLPLVAQVINFTILLVVLKKFLYAPILKILQQRQQKIVDSLVMVEKTKNEEDKLKQKKLEMLKEAREEGRVIIANAKKDAQKVRDEMLDQANQEMAKKSQKIEKDLQLKYQQLEASLAEKTVNVALEMIKRILPEILTGEQQHLVIRKQLTKIQKMAWNQ